MYLLFRCIVESFQGVSIQRDLYLKLASPAVCASKGFTFRLYLGYILLIATELQVCSFSKDKFQTTGRFDLVFVEFYNSRLDHLSCKWEQNFIVIKGTCLKKSNPKKL